MTGSIVYHLQKNGIVIHHEDDDILIINKPAPFLVLPDRFDPALPNLLALLNEAYGKVYVVHRLDKETSGVIVFAKTPEAHAALSDQFTSHTIIKTYQAIVSGNPGVESGTIDLPIAEGARGKMKIDHQRGKSSVTRYQILEQYRGYSYIELQPLTGRTHQLRVHLSAIGLPILCDELYGGGNALRLSSIKPGYKQTQEEERPLIHRIALHAFSITFIHPATKESVTYLIPAPKDITTALKYIKRFCPVS